MPGNSKLNWKCPKCRAINSKRRMYCSNYRYQGDKKIYCGFAKAQL